LPHSRELEFASRAVTAIEINGTFYRTQTPDTYRKWARETPDGFVFSLKAPRYVPGKRVLAEAGPSIEAAPCAAIAARPYRSASRPRR
jgi:uncharacterized protein YecE (DUF72 family)